MRFVRSPLYWLESFRLHLQRDSFFQQTWAAALRPLPDTRLSYTFIAAILAGGAPLIWTGLCGSQVTALMIIVFSAVLGIYSLFINPATRLRAHSGFRRNTQ